LDRDLAQILAFAARDTEKRLLRTKGIRADQLSVILRDLKEIQTQLWVQGVGPAIEGRLGDARKQADVAAQRLDTWLTSQVGRSLSSTLIDQFERMVQRGLALDALRAPSTLSTRVYTNAALASGRIETIVRAGVIRGFSAREIAQDVKKYIHPGTPGGASYAAMRLGRTELNNAFHEQAKVEAIRPWVTGAKWNRSKSHPKRDRCDEYAEHDEGLGVGVWDKNRIPNKPHPQCLCFITYEVMNEKDALNLILGRIA
jgi:hypothetical protein